MKVLQIAPIGERVPPKKYGGTERVIFELVEGLVAKDYDVTLAASGDSKTSGRLVSVYPKSLREASFGNPYSGNNISMLNIGNAYCMQDNFDIIHDHSGFLSLPTAILSRTPVVATLHGAIGPDEKRLYEGLKNDGSPYLVSISLSQRKPSPNLNYVGNVYHGINIKDYSFSYEHDGYLLFVGRIHEQKGVHHAIEVAEFLDLPLIIAAKLDLVDELYFKKYVASHLSEKNKMDRRSEHSC